MTYDSADYYAAESNAENLTHETPEEAIEAMLDSWADPKCDMRAIILQHTPLEVLAYTRRQVSDGKIDRYAEYLVETFTENLDDEYGNPDGDSLLDDVQYRALRTKIAPLLRAAVDASHIWACESSGRRAYSAAEVEAMMRKANPHWFEDAAAAQKAAKGESDGG